MVQCCAAFGPAGADGYCSYFFNSPHKWAMKNLPAQLMELFVAPATAKEVYDIALGPAGSYLIAYRDAGGLKLRHHDLPAGLEKWLIPNPGKGVVRNLELMDVTLGPNGSYFAIDADGAAAWGSLPDGLEASIQQCLKPGGGWKAGLRPLSVSLGPDGAYTMTNENGCGEWDLKGQNPTLTKWFQDADDAKGVVRAPSHPFHSPPGRLPAIFTVG